MLGFWKGVWVGVGRGIAIAVARVVVTKLTSAMRDMLVSYALGARAKALTTPDTNTDDMWAEFICGIARVDE